MIKIIKVYKTRYVSTTNTVYCNNSNNGYVTLECSSIENIKDDTIFVSILIRFRN